jgi:putative membrane protein
MQWWCFAQQEPWTWTWRPLVGVWVMVALLGWAYHRLLVSLAKEDPGLRVEPWRRVSFGGALFLLWVSLDWPVGPLGASYFASVHAAQYVAVGVAAPALLLLALPGRAFRRLWRGRVVPSVLGPLTHPAIAFFVFSAVMTITHWPAVVDGLMRSQAGSFLLDASWLAAGLVFWWPLVAPVPERPGFSPLAKIGYLALNAFLIRPPFAMMVFSSDPIYAIYELAPPPAGDAMEDQQLGGVIMEMSTAWIMFAGVAAVFRQWMKAERDREARQQAARGTEPAGQGWRKPT